jgi:hypothetical protein
MHGEGSEVGPEMTAVFTKRVFRTNRSITGRGAIRRSLLTQNIHEVRKVLSMSYCNIAVAERWVEEDQPGAETITIDHQIPWTCFASRDLDPNGMINVFRTFSLNWNSGLTSRSCEKSTTNPRQSPKSWFNILVPKPYFTWKCAIGYASLLRAANRWMYEDQDDSLISYVSREFRPTTNFDLSESLKKIRNARYCSTIGRCRSTNWEESGKARIIRRSQDSTLLVRSKIDCLWIHPAFGDQSTFWIDAVSEICKFVVSRELSSTPKGMEWD